MSRLNTLTLLATKIVPARDKRFELLQSMVLKEVRKQKIAWMERNNEEAQKFVDLYCRALSSHVLTPNSKIRIPGVS